MASRSKKKDNKILYIVILFGFLIILAIIFGLNKNSKNNAETDVYEETEEQTESTKSESITAELENMEERDRMEFYFGMFLEYIESEEYEKAYDLLYPEFKQNYFPTIDSFIEYVQKTFSEMSNIEHENIERNGDVYVLWIYITDALNGKPGEKKEMNIVIKENDYNDFVMSFSVI